MKSQYDLEAEAREKIKEIVMKMNGLTEEQVIDKYIHNIHFSKGFDVLVDLFKQAKFGE
jgi:hypothetical protein